VVTAEKMHGIINFESYSVTAVKSALRTKTTTGRHFHY